MRSVTRKRARKEQSHGDPLCDPTGACVCGAVLHGRSILASLVIKDLRRLAVTCTSGRAAVSGILFDLNATLWIEDPIYSARHGPVQHNHHGRVRMSPELLLAASQVAQNAPGVE